MCQYRIDASSKRINDKLADKDVGYAEFRKATAGKIGGLDLAIYKVENWIDQQKDLIETAKKNAA